MSIEGFSSSPSSTSFPNPSSSSSSSSSSTSTSSSSSPSCSASTSSSSSPSSSSPSSSTSTSSSSPSSTSTSSSSPSSSSSTSSSPSSCSSVKVFNVNVGLLGHVDSGKTSLARCLTTTPSTASLDKNPQSQQRGITIDLGFSAFFLEEKEKEKKKIENDENEREEKEKEGVMREAKQICLVDCPGHATLIKTVLGGAQIIDATILVIDITKGIQTQTAECLVIAEILSPQLIVALNKIDLIPEHLRSRKIANVISKLRQNVFSKTRFGADVTMVAIAANPQYVESEICSNGIRALGVDELKEAMRVMIRKPIRDARGQLCMAFDHCFSVKGQGTVLTGTLLSGSLSVGQKVQVGNSGKSSQIRSLQMFRKSVNWAQQGDRVAMCLSAVDATKLERGLVTDPKHPLPIMWGCIAVVEKVKYYKLPILNKTKFHCTIGHTTVMCTGQFFALLSKNQSGEEVMAQGGFEGKQEEEGRAKGKSGGMEGGGGDVSSLCLMSGGRIVKPWPIAFDFNEIYYHLAELPIVNEDEASNDKESLIDLSAYSNYDKKLPSPPLLTFAVIKFEHPVQCSPRSTIICSKLDLDAHTRHCRLAFWGKVLEPFPGGGGGGSDRGGGGGGGGSGGVKGEDVLSVFLKKVKVIKVKEKWGNIDRWTEKTELIGKNLFKDAEHVGQFEGSKIHLVCVDEISNLTRMVSSPTSSSIITTGTPAAVSSTISTTTTTTTTTATAIPSASLSPSSSPTSSSSSSVLGKSTVGVIEKSFGKKGKFILRFDAPPLLTTKVEDPKSDFRLLLRYKKFVFDKSARIFQIPSE